MILLISLTVSCKSSQVIPPEIPIDEKPEKPFEESPFEYVDSLIVISPDNAVLLAVYLTELESYIDKLLIIIDYYKPGEE